MEKLKDLKLEAGRDEKVGRGGRKNLRFRAQGEDTTIYEKFRKVERKNNKEDVAFIIKCLNKHFIFFSLMEDVHAIEYLIDNLFYCEIKAGDVIIKQGDNASSFFILHTGKIEVQVNGIAKKELKPGEGLGELALLYNAERSASCKALENCTLWGIDRTTFRKIVE
jgi:cGMP-dependent protein kinase